jgi:hypothetical protein
MVIRTAVLGQGQNGDLASMVFMIASATCRVRAIPIDPQAPEAAGLGASQRWSAK